MSQSLYMCIKQNNPDNRITVMAPSWTRPLLDRMPEVDAKLKFDLKHGELNLGARRSLGKSLRDSNFTQAIVLPLSFKSALVPFHANIKTRTGWRGEWRNILLNDCRPTQDENFPLMVQRFAALANPSYSLPPENIPKPKLSTQQSDVNSSLSKFELTKELKILAISPGAEFGEAKQWPSEYYAELMNAVLQQGWQVWIFGSAKDREVAELIVAQVPEKFRNRVKILAGQTSLAEAVDLMAQANVVISNDSGLMHIAAALGRPLVAVYGSTSPDFTPPLAQQMEVVRLGLECSPCFKRECPLEHLNCLRQLSPDIVFAAVQRLLQDAPQPVDWRD